MALVLTLVAGLVGLTEVRLIGDALQRPEVAEFYTQPPGAADGDPGTLIKSEQLWGDPVASRAWRIMYRSTDLNGDPVVVTGMVIVPLAPAPPGGRTVVSWGHPTVGSAAHCAPSRAFDPSFGIEGLRMLLDRGYAVVATDYAGMGTDGPDSYLIGVTEGNNVLDAVRAVQRMPEVEASADVILWGHSQGGQAVLFAAEDAADYAPELKLRAVAVAAPAADLSALLSAHLDDISGVTIGSYAFAAFADVYGPTVPGAELDAILTPQAVALNAQLNELCLLTHLEELHRLGQPLVGAFMLADPTTTEPWATLLQQNSAGRRAFDAPLFVAQGLADELVVPADTAAFVEHEAGLGIDVTSYTVPFADHGTIAYLAVPELDAWLDGHGLR